MSLKCLYDRKQGVEAAPTRRYNRLHILTVTKRDGRFVFFEIKDRIHSPVL